VEVSSFQNRKPATVTNNPVFPVAMENMPAETRVMEVAAMRSDLDIPAFLRRRVR